MTARPDIFSQLRCWAGESAASTTMTSAPSALASSASSAALPLPRRIAGDSRRSLTSTDRLTDSRRFSTSSRQLDEQLRALALGHVGRLHADQKRSLERGLGLQEIRHVTRLDHGTGARSRNSCGRTGLRRRGGMSAGGTSPLGLGPIGVQGDADPMKPRIPALALALALASLARAQVTIDATAVPPPPSPLGFPVGGRSPDGRVLSADSRTLTLDGRPWFPVMGEFHFSRYPAEEWGPELLKMKAGGVGIVSTYVFWIHHEETEGRFDWAGQRDLRRFVQLCARDGLLVWVRIGPWAHGEVRNGGFPDWLVERSPIRGRTTPGTWRTSTGTSGKSAGS